MSGNSHISGSLTLHLAKVWLCSTLHSSQYAQQTGLHDFCHSELDSESSKISSLCQRHRSHLQRKFNISVDACSSLSSFVALLYAALLAVNATARTYNENSTFPLMRARLSLRSWLCSERKKKTYFAISRWKINRKKGKEIFIFVLNFAKAG